MKKSVLIGAMALLLPLSSMAQSFDIMGGADGSTQTMYHCGFLQTSAKDYASSPVLVSIIERKLRSLGYLGRSSSKQFKAAVRAFQADYGLAADGVVGARTAQKLAFVSHPSAHVRRCAE